AASGAVRRPGPGPGEPGRPLTTTLPPLFEENPMDQNTGTASAQVPVAAAPSQGTHHYVMTLQKPMPNGVGYAVHSFSGTCTPGAGASRYDLYLWVMAEMVRTAPQLAGSTVLFFDVQPNRI
ncbi:hypothetical protein ACWC5I_45635, partial [Kitasatospora sp. NPDC001574]